MPPQCSGNYCRIPAPSLRSLEAGLIKMAIKSPAAVGAILGCLLIRQLKRFAALWKKGGQLGIGPPSLTPVQFAEPGWEPVGSSGLLLWPGGPGEHLLSQSQLPPLRPIPQLLSAASGSPFATLRGCVNPTVLGLASWGWGSIVATGRPGEAARDRRESTLSGDAPH